MYAGLTRDIRVTDSLDNHDKSESAKGKKARWFAEIKRQTLVNNTSRLVKDEFRLNKKIQQTVRPPLFKHKKDKQNKDWIIFEDQKSKSWMLGRIEKKKEKKLSVEHWVERKVNNGDYFIVRCKHCALNQREKKNNCITEIKIDSVKGCIHNMTKNKENWTLPCALDLLLRRKFVESPSKHKLIDSIEIAEMEIELINGLNLEK
ncbi:2412_t:CDS:2 [Gigaspora margarita]|uniref:2412_t:CDS:1 n=1 Tax=Gigaspora margarita TaxID=4874 RepID=A0ABN7VME6_GIGMA|nr:2412_t:CDS:2 [Gigaspora margarita]